MTFSVQRTRFVFSPAKDFLVAQGLETNLFRGAIGKAFRTAGCTPDCLDPGVCRNQNHCLYSRWFDPQWPGGPSGYRDAPRPFVLRWVGSVPVSDNRLLGLDFLTFAPALEWKGVEEAVREAIAQRTGATSIEVRDRLTLQLPVFGEPSSGALTVAFVEPTEIKSSGEVLLKPAFSEVAKRLAERVWSLGCFYQGWPGVTALSGLLDEAASIELLQWHWVRTERKRLSARSGQKHSIGGFTGWAKYGGPVGRFLPLLEIGTWTGVGRQTVWGKGALRIEAFERAS